MGCEDNFCKKFTGHILPPNSTPGQVKRSRFTGIFEVQKNTEDSSNGFLQGTSVHSITAGNTEV